MTTKGYTVLAFLLGGVVGAGIALLYAPASGEETRKRIKEGALDARARAGEKFDEVRETVTEGTAKVKQMFEDKKAEVKAAYEAGREAYLREKEHRGATS